MYSVPLSAFSIIFSDFPHAGFIVRIRNDQGQRVMSGVPVYFEPSLRDDQAHPELLVRLEFQGVQRQGHLNDLTPACRAARAGFRESDSRASGLAG